MKEKLSVIIPVYNSSNFIRENLEIMKIRFREYFPDLEIIVVIDGDKKSYEEAKKVSGIKLHGYSRNRGKGFALKYGFTYCTGDYVTFFDGDLDFNPQHIKNFFPYLATADILIGSKRHPFSKVNYPMYRRFLSKAFQLYSKLILGVALRDTQSGFKLMKKEVLDVLMPLVVVKKFAFDLELMFLAQKHGFRTVEVPIKMIFGKKGSTINYMSMFETVRGMFLDVLAIRYRYSIRKYYQKKYEEEFFR